nr:polysaccharide deacetylase family protein [Fundicoccus ignavus]
MFECDALARRLSGSILDERKLIALTFDDGPNPSYTPQVLDILAQYDVKATFFLLGQEVVKYPELVKEIADAGHLVENHSFGHPDFATISDDELLDEINRTQEAIYDAAGILPTMYRMPYGSGGARVVQMFPDLQSVIWNVDSEDWVSEDAYTIYLNVMENLLQHTVLLMHDKDQSTVDSLELLIPELIAQGYEFVSPLEINMEFLYYE